MKLEQKKTIVKDLQERFSKKKILIVTDYKGLNVQDVNLLRRKLREAGTEYKVVKNSLLVRACKDTDVEMLKDYFTGPSAIALSYDDPVAPAKLLTEFARENKKLEIKVGVMNGKVLDLSKIDELSSLPSHEVLLGQLLSVMNGVPTSLVRALGDVPRKMLNLLQAIKEQKEAA